MLTIAAPSIMTTCTTGVVGIVLYRNDIFQAATQIRVHFTFIRRCHFAFFVVQHYQALDKIFGLLCDHVPSILVSQEGQYDSILSDSNINLKGRKDSPTGDMQQKKHVSVEGGASSTD